MSTLDTSTAEAADPTPVAGITPTIDGKLDRLLERQEVLILTVASMSEQLGTQAEMLAAILGAAREEPGDSPVADLLAQLAAAVNDNTRAVMQMSEELLQIPDEIGNAIAKAIATEEPDEASPEG